MALQIALVVLGVPLLAIALLQGHTLYVGLTRPATSWPPPGERIQFPAHHQSVKRALAEFAALPPSERAAFRAGVEDALRPLPQWLTALDRRPAAILCIGENHEPYLRRFLADRLFPVLKADVLLIEATAREAERLRARVEAGDDPVLLLGADVARLLRSALAANPALEIAGIEERPEQLSARRGQDTGSREGSIEANFRASFQPGRRHVVLYGAFHCSRQGGWLFQRLRRQPPPGTPAGSLLNLRVAWEHLEPPFETFTYFLDEIGFPPGDFVIADPEALPDEIADWFPFLSANELRVFGAVAVFRWASVTSPEAARGVGPIGDSRAKRKSILDNDEYGYHITFPVRHTGGRSERRSLDEDQWNTRRRAPIAARARGSAHARGRRRVRGIGEWTP